MTMNLIPFSNWLEQATQPGHPFYHPSQIALFASLSYVSTACLTSLPPLRGMTLTILAYSISQFTTPLFSQLFEPYRNKSLAPFIGQVLQLSTSLMLAKVFCRLVGQSLSLKEMRQVSLVFMTCLYVSRIALLKLRQNCSGKNYQ